MTFGQLLRGYAEEARKELKKIIRSRASLGELVPANSAFLAPERLKPVPVKVFGRNAQAPSEFGVVADLISHKLANSLSLEV